MASPFDAPRFAVDEDVYLEAPEDFYAIVPARPLFAAGADGAVAGGSRVLTSASADFGAQGTDLGAMCYLTHDDLGNEPVPFVVAAVSGGSLTLREVELDDDEGGPIAATTLANVEFEVFSLRKKLTDESLWVARELDFDLAATLTDAEDLRRVVACRVAARLYRTASRNPDDQYAKLAGARLREADAMVADLQGRRRESYPIEAVSVVPTDNAQWSPRP